MEQKQLVMSIGLLVAGTPLGSFLAELASITDEELVESEKPIQEGEIVLGEMTPFEKRLNMWYDRRKAELNAKMKAFHAEMLHSEKANEQDIIDGMKQLADFDEATEGKLALLGESISNRFPDADNIAIRAGFTVVANARRAQKLSGFSVEIVSGTSSLAAALMGMPRCAHRHL